MPRIRRKKYADSVSLNFVEGIDTVFKIIICHLRSAGKPGLQINSENIPIRQSQSQESALTLQPPFDDVHRAISDDDCPMDNCQDSTSVPVKSSRTYHSRQVKLNEAWESIRTKMTQDMIKLAIIATCPMCIL